MLIGLISGAGHSQCIHRDARSAKADGAASMTPPRARWGDNSKPQRSIAIESDGAAKNIIHHYLADGVSQ